MSETLTHTTPPCWATPGRAPRCRPGAGPPRRLTIAVAGGKSPAWMRNGTRALAAVLPAAQHRVLDGQTHMVKATALAPVLVEFFGA